jgi:hypothetical protein
MQCISSFHRLRDMTVSDRYTLFVRSSHALMEYKPGLRCCCELQKKHMKRSMEGGGASRLGAWSLLASLWATRKREHLRLQHLLPTTGVKRAEKIKGRGIDVNTDQFAIRCRLRTFFTHSLTATFERSGPAPAALTAGRTMLSLQVEVRRARGGVCQPHRYVDTGRESETSSPVVKLMKAEGKDGICASATELQSTVPQ